MFNYSSIDWLRSPNGTIRGNEQERLSKSCRFPCTSNAFQCKWCLSRDDEILSLNCLSWLDYMTNNTKCIDTRWLPCWPASSFWSTQLPNILFCQDRMIPVIMEKLKLHFFQALAHLFHHSFTLAFFITIFLLLASRLLHDHLLHLFLFWSRHDWPIERLDESTHEHLWNDLEVSILWLPLEHGVGVSLYSWWNIHEAKSIIRDKVYSIIIIMLYYSLCVL